MAVAGDSLLISCALANGLSPSSILLLYLYLIKMAAEPSFAEFPYVSAVKSVSCGKVDIPIFFSPLVPSPVSTSEKHSPFLSLLG